MPLDPKLQKLGERMRAGRREANLTQAELAQACGISTNLISNIELGYNWPSLPIFLKICRALYPGKSIPFFTS